MEHVTTTILGLPFRELPIRELPVRELPVRGLPFEELLREEVLIEEVLIIIASIKSLQWLLIILEYLRLFLFKLIIIIIILFTWRAPFQAVRAKSTLHNIIIIVNLNKNNNRI